jgi:acyl-CoA thioesterase
MQYTLITKQGRVYTFFFPAVAAQFQQAYGGVVFSQQLLAAADLSENGSCATI